jgi:hypothetical protein
MDFTFNKITSRLIVKIRERVALNGKHLSSLSLTITVRL